MIYLYADVYFAVNFTMNWALLWLAGRLLGERTPVWRGLAAASAGAAYALLLLVPNAFVFLSPVAKVLFSFFMVAIAFGPRSIRQLLRQSAYFFMVALATAGAFMAMEAFAPQGENAGLGNLAFLEGARRSAQAASWMFLAGAKELSATASAYPTVPWWFLLAAVAMAGSTLGIVWLESRLSMRTVKDREVYDARISMGDHIITARLLLDTGNGLKDPYTGTPVVVVDPSRLNGVLPTGLLLALRGAASAGISGAKRRITTMSEWIEGIVSDQPWMLTRLRLIPFTGVNGEKGMLVGLRADALEVEIEGRPLRTDRVVIALSPFARGREHSFDGLLHPEIFSSLKSQRSYVERRDTA
ncbi:MAG TPA: sigma-E processing peptidase SpoIIGA [Clostridia bacterium]|nr:sigma-E processing peptidase SpoIIGA [Clostridia bacterium]